MAQVTYKFKMFVIPATWDAGVDYRECLGHLFNGTIGFTKSESPVGLWSTLPPDLAARIRAD